MSEDKHREDHMEEILLDVQSKLYDVLKHYGEFDCREIIKKANEFNAFLEEYIDAFGTIKQHKEDEDKLEKRVSTIEKLHGSHEEQCTPLQIYRLKGGTLALIISAIIFGLINLALFMVQNLIQ